MRVEIHLHSYDVANYDLPWYYQKQDTDQFFPDFDIEKTTDEELFEAIAKDLSLPTTVLTVAKYKTIRINSVKVSYVSIIKR